MVRTRRGILSIAFLLAAAVPAHGFRAPDLSASEQAELKRDFAPCLSKLKGPYTENFCVCRKTGEKLSVTDKAGRVRSPCGPDPLFCAAFRAPWAEALGKKRMWIANIFSGDLWLWESFPDHHDLVRGYILEKYFVETNPKHKLAELRAYGGLSGSEFEVGASTEFFERYLAAPDFDGAKHFPLAYELQRRFFVRDDLGQIQKVRNMAVRVQSAQAKFKPMRDAIHNQITAGLLPKLAAYRDQLPAGSIRNQVDEIIEEIAKLTALDESALRLQLTELGDADARSKLEALVPAPDADPVQAISRLAQLMVLARETVVARRVSAGDARQLIDLDITAGAIIQRRGSTLLEQKSPLSVKQHVELLAALTDAAYGAGLLVQREQEAAHTALDALLANPNPSRKTFAGELAKAARVVEWAPANATLGYAEVWAPWTFLLPQVASIGDDILRASPLLLYADFLRRLDDHVSGSAAIRHDLFGAELSSDVRALNSGLALGRLRVAGPGDPYTRDEVVALSETPSDLEPAAGILTQGEGNVLSHVQLLARALGIPNVVLGPSAFARLKPHDGKLVFLIVTPGGRVILKEAAAMTAAERQVYEEFTRNDERNSDGSLAADAKKLHIDPSKIDLTRKLPVDLAEIRRKDSGRLSGPKGAFLGELKHLFPADVTRGIVVPFGAYYDHYQRAPVAVPETLRSAGVATAGEPLKDFVARTYDEFFGKLVPTKSERELSAWIAPRLEVVRHSIRQAPLAPELRQAIRDDLDRIGLLTASDKTRTVGCFVRSDTNVEDLDNFNGAGLNLTIFNLVSLDDIEQGLKRVWASPFELRSFSWRQTLIDKPLWVLPSVVILESVPSEKSGVLITADIETGDPQKMVVATSEGVGGAVDGTSAETLRWSEQNVEIMTLFKSPWKNALQPGGGSKVVPSTGRDRVLEPDELKQLIAAGQSVREKLEPALDPAGKPRPWDIEFGFKDGKLWLFQSRPFIGNDNLKNVPALAALDGPAPGAGAGATLSLEETLR